MYIHASPCCSVPRLREAIVQLSDHAWHQVQNGFRQPPSLSECSAVAGCQIRYGFTLLVSTRMPYGFTPLVYTRMRYGFTHLVSTRMRFHTPLVSERMRYGFTPLVSTRMRYGFTPLVSERMRYGFAPLVSKWNRPCCSETVSVNTQSDP